MNYRTVKTQPLKVFGLEGLISTTGEDGYYTKAGELWQENHRNGKYEQLCLDVADEPNAIYGEMFVRDMCRVHGLMNYKKINDTTYGYMQCGLAVPAGKTDGYAVLEVPAATWAVFPIDLIDWDVGAAMRELNRRFYSEWLPTAEYEKADAPEMEMYGGTPGKGYFELWMPIVRK